MNTAAKQKAGSLFLLAAALFGLLLLVHETHGEPEGASVLYITNTSKNTSSPDYRTDAKGTITTVVLNTIQQNGKWKAYVGNISALLVLRDLQEYSIYEWSSLSSPTGQIYITRNGSITWTNITCANSTHILEEESELNITDSSTDSINSTFSGDKHRGFVVGLKTITNSTCPSAATWVNDTAQAVTEEALFQEVLLSDGNSLIYTGLMEQDKQGYRNDSATTYDFQVIIADHGLVTEGPVTYYFYIEVS